jgi:hypothetical protein
MGVDDVNPAIMLQVPESPQGIEREGRPNSVNMDALYFLVCHTASANHVNVKSELDLFSRECENVRTEIGGRLFISSCRPGTGEARDHSTDSQLEVEWHNLIYFCLGQIGIPSEILDFVSITYESLDEVVALSDDTFLLYGATAGPLKDKELSRARIHSSCS